MKSMLQEGSSISKAIEKAWDNSGRPHEFTIKILEMGDKSLWGITRRPSVISITYDPRKQTQSVKSQEIKPREVIQKKPENKKNGLFQSLFGKKEVTRKPFQQPIPRKDGRRFSDYTRDEREGWNKVLIDDATNLLKDMFRIMNVQANFSIKAEQKLLTINLDKRVLREAEAEKLFFISLSHLSMQFLKKKHRKKFKNYYLIIHSKLTENNAAKKPENTSK